MHHQFFHNNKTKVVRITCQNGEEEPLLHGAGFFINGEGLILTVARLGCKSPAVITIRTTSKQHPSWRATFIASDDKFGLLKIDAHFTSVNFGGVCSNGQEVRIIFHPNGHFYSYNVGQIACDKRSVHDLLLIKDPKLTDLCHKLNFKKNDDFIQLNNIHGERDGQGAPIFDTQERVIGVYAFHAINYDFAIPAEDALSFIEKHNYNNEENESKRKRQRTGEGSGSKH